MSCTDCGDKHNIIILELDANPRGEVYITYECESCLNQWLIKQPELVWGG